MLIKLMIVDDEQLILDGIKKILSRDHRGFEIVSEAGSGEEAEEKALRIRPDVIITDISMYEMNGLTLIERLKPHLEDTKFIVISGYDDFDYVRQALIQGVLDYVLKPIASDDIYKLLDHVRVIIEQENVEKSKSISIRNRLYESNTLKRENIFREYLLMEGLGNSKANLADVVMKQDEALYLVIMITPDYNDGHYKSVWEEDRESFLAALYNLVNEHTSKAYNGISLVMESSLIVLLCLIELKTDIINVNTDLINIVQRYLKVVVNISVGQISKGMHLIYDSYLSAREAEYSRFFIQNQQIIGVTQLDFSLKDDIFDVNGYEKRLVTAIGKGEEISARDTLKDLIDHFKKERIHPQYILDYSERCMDQILHGISEEGYSIDEMLPFREPFLKKIHTLSHIDQLHVLLIETIQHMIDARNMKRINSDCKIVEVVKDYLKERYSQDITLLELSQVVYISPKYLSDLFKKETGINFIDYLTKLRMDKAKELLKQLDYKTYEICEKVGYQSPKHFSKVFKKNTGMTPTEYRENLK